MTLRSAFFNPTTGLLRAGWRIPFLILWVAPLFVGMGLFSRFLRAHLSGPAVGVASAATGLIFIGGALAIFQAFVRVVEKRPEASELKVDGATLRHAGLGFLFGGGAMLLIVALLTLAGSYRVKGLGHPAVLAKSLFFYLPQSFSEDFVFCLILFRAMKQGLGRQTALLVAPLLFSAAHLGNTNESVLGLLEIFTAGVLMYYLFDRTGSFFSVWMLHFSWNFTMNGVFGLANSGQSIPGFLQARVSGPTWLTGGATGPEASILALSLDLLLLGLVWRLSDARLKARAA